MSDDPAKLKQANELLSRLNRVFLKDKAKGAAIVLTYRRIIERNFPWVAMENLMVGMTGGTDACLLHRAAESGDSEAMFLVEKYPMLRIIDGGSGKRRQWL
jgi:hypothetical protein